MHISTSLPIIPAGTPIEGGYHACFLPRLDGGMYQLILPPRAIAEFSGLTWKQAVEAVSGLEGCVLPSKLDGMALFTLFAPHRQSTPELFRSGGTEAFMPELYWLDEEYSTYGAWRQYFGYGIQGVWHKNYSNRVRAVRNVLI